MPLMETSSLTARQYWEQVKANPNRAKFGFGSRPAIVNIDVQRAYTDLDAFKTHARSSTSTVCRRCCASGACR